MDWAQVLAIISVNIALIYWMRQDTKDVLNRIEGWKEEINREMKDFHGRLCALQERSKEKRDP